MKKILVPTDFSPLANHALEYAIEIAAKFKSQLYLYHVYHISKVDYHLHLSDDEQPLKKQVERKMHLVKIKYEKELLKKGVSLKTIVEQADIFSLFKRKVKENGIDLIIMGTKGATGLKKVVFGSVAAAALEMSKVPVLLIPPGYSYDPPERILLAADHKDIPPGVLVPLQQLALNFGAKATVLNVNNGSKKNNSQKMEIYLKGVETSFREVSASGSINEAINAFIEKEGFDLLCMIRREKGFLESLFQKSITKTQAFNSQCPLLVLPENSNTD